MLSQLLIDHFHHYKIMTFKNLFQGFIIKIKFINVLFIEHVR